MDVMMYQISIEGWFLLKWDSSETLPINSLIHASLTSLMYLWICLHICTAVITCHFSTAHGVDNFFPYLSLISFPWTCHIVISRYFFNLYSITVWYTVWRRFYLTSHNYGLQQYNLKTSKRCFNGMVKLSAAFTQSLQVS